MGAAAEGPKEINQPMQPLLDVGQLVRFPLFLKDAGRQPAGIATTAGTIVIKKATRYALAVITTALNFYLSRSDLISVPPAAIASDPLVPAGMIFYFYSGDYDNLTASGTTGVLTELSM